MRNERCGRESLSVRAAGPPSLKAGLQNSNPYSFSDCVGGARGINYPQSEIVHSVPSDQEDSVMRQVHRAVAFAVLGFLVLPLFAADEKKPDDKKDVDKKGPEMVPAGTVT